MSSYSDFEQKPRKPTPPKDAISPPLPPVILGICGGVAVALFAGLVAAVVLTRRSFTDSGVATAPPAELTAKDTRTTPNNSESSAVIGMSVGGEGLAEMSFLYNVDSDSTVHVGLWGTPRARNRTMLLRAFSKEMNDPEEMRRQILQGTEEFQEIAVETSTFPILGEECNVRVARGRNENGDEMRQCTALFHARNGCPAMLLLVLSEEDWRESGQRAFEQTLVSIK